MMKSTGKDYSKKIPKIKNDPGDYDRGSVLNDGDDSIPTNITEWAGNKPGWKGMPVPLGSPKEPGEGGEQEQL